MAHPPRTIGLDLSLTATGIAVLGHAGKVLSVSLCGSKPSVGTGDTRRISLLAEEVLARCLPRPQDLIVIEDYAFSGNGQITRLAEFGGTLKYKLQNEFHLPQERVCLCHNGTLKKFLTGKGNAQKQVVMMSVLKRWGCEFRDDNEADAFGLALIGHYAQGGVLPGHEKLTAAETEAMEKFKGSCVLWAGWPAKKAKKPGKVRLADVE